MFLSSIKNSVSSRLGIQSTLVVIVLIIIISGLLTSFFIMRQKNILTEEHRTRIQTLGENLVYDCRSFLLRKNFPDNMLVYGVNREKDILDTYITDSEGVIELQTSQPRRNRIIIPAHVDSFTEKNWFSTAHKNIWRLILPIEVNVENEISEMTLNGDIPPDKTVREEDTIRLYGRCVFPTFTPDSGEVTFSSSFYGGGISTTYSIGIKNKKIRIILEKCKSFWGRNGWYLACNALNDEKTWDLLIYDTEKGEIRKIGNTGGIDPTNCITPDNKYVITSMAVDGIDKLFRFPFEGGEPEQLTFHQSNHWYPKCSPDGKWILYTVIPEKELWVYNSEKKESMRVFPDLELRHYCGCFSPDGKKICYVLFPDSTLSSLSSELYVADFPFETAAQTKKSNHGVRIVSKGINKWYTSWSPDGKWITYGQQGDIWIVPSRGGDPINLTEPFKKRERIGYVVLDVSTERLKTVIRDSTYKSLFIMLVVICFGVIATMYVEKKHTELEKAHEELRKAHGQLEKTYKELETLDKAKDDFLSLVSHELRTPLGSMLLHAEMLLNRLVGSDEKQAFYHAMIVKNCKRLTRLINDVLDLSKIEAGRMSYTFGVLPVRELLSDVYSSLRPSFENKMLNFDFESVPGEICLRGDRDKIIQVLTNILTNATKFTPPQGTITVSLTTSEKTATIAIKDTGPGIEKEKIPKVFDRFSQLEDINHHSDGTGLGMTISKLIIENHGGSIWIESEPGKGTTVFFTLPLAEIRPEPAMDTGKVVVQDVEKSGKSVRKPEPKKLLIVDDELSYRQAIADCVQSAGYESLEAEDGLEALRKVKEYKPDLLILDVMMSGLSGLDVCRTLKKDPGTHGIKIIILSARGQEREKKKGLQEGADRYMTKPFDYKELIAAIEELLP